MPWRYYFLSFTCKDIDVVTVTVMCNFSFDIQNFLMQEANVLYLCFLLYGFDRNLNIFRCVFFPFSLLILYSISAYLLNLLKSAGLFLGSRLQTSIAWLSPAGPIRFAATVQRYLLSVCLPEFFRVAFCECSIVLL